MRNEVLLGKEGITVGGIGTVAQVVGPNEKSSYTKVLLVNVIIGDDKIHHLWVTPKKEMKRGDTISFRGKVRRYLSVNDKGDKVVKYGIPHLK